MSDDGNRRPAEAGGRSGSSEVLRPIASPAWSGLLGETDTATGRTRVRGHRRPFAGVLGPWRPSVDGPPPRLSFLVLPWPVREIRTTERVVREGRTGERSPPADATPGTTTVRRLLRTDEGERSDGPVVRRGEYETTAPADGTVAGTAETLREVLRWRPVPGIGPAPSDRTGDPPGTGPSGLRLPLRTTPAGRAGDRGADRTGAGGGRAGTDGCGSGAGTTAEPRGGTTEPTPPGDRQPWPLAVGESTGDRWPTGRVRSPVLAGDAPTVLHPPGGTHRSEAGAPARGRSGESSAERPEGTSRADRGERTEPTLDGVSAVSPGRGVGPSAVDLPAPRRAAPDPVRLAYRRADAGIGRAIRGTGTSPGGAARAVATAGVRTPPDARPLGTPSATGRPGVTDETVPGRRDAPAGASHSPRSPFASFPDADAAVEFVYREIERRWRVERERRGL